MNQLALELAAAAARLVADEGMEYAAAKRRAARELLRRGSRQPELPSNEQVEDALREHIALFHADTQPEELHALRTVARVWMQRLEAFRPHLSGAVWRGTATRHSAIHLDLYCDDSKACEIALINAGVRYDAAGASADDTPVLTVAERATGWEGYHSVHLLLHDLDAHRGALKPDARGRSWRGDLAALDRLLAQEGSK